MTRMRILLILDSTKYKSREKRLNTGAFKIETDLFYTDYENRLIKIFHGIPVAGNFLSHLSYWLISVFSALKLTVRYRKKYTHLIFINPIVGLFYCMMLPFKGLKVKIYLSGFLFVAKSSRAYFNLRKKLVNLSLRRVSGIFVYSSKEVRLYSEMFPELASKFKFIKYGRDFDIFAEKEYESEGEYIASGGISNRDYNVLASAMKQLEEKHKKITCRIATRPGTYSAESPPRNIEFLFNIRIDRIGSFLEKSKFVVLPLLNSSLSAGHMTLFESMSLGKNIIIADIPAVRDYVNNDIVFFYRAGDASDLAGKIEYLDQNYSSPELIKRSKNLQDTYRSEYSFNSFLERIASEIE